MSHLELNILSAIHDMSAIWDVRHREVSLYFSFKIIKQVTWTTELIWEISIKRDFKVELCHNNQTLVLKILADEHITKIVFSCKTKRKFSCNLIAYYYCCYYYYYILLLLLLELLLLLLLTLLLLLLFDVISFLTETI